MPPRRLTIDTGMAVTATVVAAMPSSSNPGPGAVDRDTVNPEETRRVEAALAEFLAGSVPTTVAAEQLVPLASVSEPAASRDHRYWVLWGEILARAAEAESHHEALIALTAEAFSVERTAGSDLNLMVWECRDTFEHYTGLVQHDEAERTAQAEASSASPPSLTTIQREWMNFTLFQARCYAARTAGRLPRTVSLDESFLLLEVVEALETDPQPTTASQVESHLIAAAAWLVHVSGLVLQSCREGKRGWPETPGRLERSLWRGEWDAVSVARWRFWVWRMKELHQMRFADETRLIVRRAVAAMEEAERQAGLGEE